MCRRVRPIPDHSVSSDRQSNIFEVLVTQIKKLNADLTSDMFVSRRRNADATRLRNVLEPRRDIDAVPKDIMWFDDHVTDIDADPEGNASILRVGGRKFSDAGLELRSSSYRLYGARKLRQEPVAGILHDAAAVFSDCRVGNLRQKISQSCVCGFFVMVHEPRIASHIGG